MSTIEERIQDLTERTRAELRAITFDPFEDEAVVKAAQRLIEDVNLQRLRQAVQRFEDATQVLADLTAKLLAIVRQSKGDARILINPVLGDAAVLLRDLAGDADEDAPKAVIPGVEDEPRVDDRPSAPTGVQAAPPPGTVSTSRRLAEIADEYRATFAAAVIKPDKLERVDRACARLVAFRDEYQRVGGPLGIPWAFIGVIHALESSFNFGRHLHNGDRLSGRTVRVPSGRPPPEAGDPPFTWHESASDALIFKGFHTESDWSLPALLFHLERYNGFGYRMRGLASPYLWSFSDRYLKGKFVRDGAFDPEFVSNQCGSAVLLKFLDQHGEVTLT